MAAQLGCVYSQPRSSTALAGGRQGYHLRADGDVPDPEPGVQPGLERPEWAVIRQPGKSGESECCWKKLAALVEHGLLDDLVGA